MEKLKPCPFCGGKAVIKSGIYTTGSSKTGRVPEGVNVVDRIQMKDSSVRIIWNRVGYTIHCPTTKCFCRVSTPKFGTEEEAINAWNHREIIEKGDAHDD